MPKPPAAMDVFARQAAPQAAPPRDAGRQRSDRVVAQALMANAQSMQQISSSLAALVRYVNAPKEIIRDGSGRAVGIRPMR